MPAESTSSIRMPSRAMVFAAGLGTRMRPVSDHTPKALVEVGGKPLIDHTLDRLAEAGVATTIVNVHHFADQVERHLALRRRPRIVISDERSLLLDQGGGIKKALPLLGEDAFFICNTDAFWIEGPRSNLRRLAAAWDPQQMDMLLLVAGSATSIGVEGRGDFTLDAEGRLKRREERGMAPFVYSGVGIIKPQLFRHERRDVFRLAPYFFDAALADRLYGLRLDGIWLHVGTPEAIAEANRVMARSII
jgi:MurNAc alpha-1-phosphate uridylyltransferase